MHVAARPLIRPSDPRLDPIAEKAMAGHHAGHCLVEGGDALGDELEREEVCRQPRHGGERHVRQVGQHHWGARGHEAARQLVEVGLELVGFHAAP